MRKRIWLLLPALVLIIALSAGLAAAAPGAPKKALEDLTPAEIEALFKKSHLTDEEALFLMKISSERSLAELRAEKSRSEEELMRERREEYEIFLRERNEAFRKYAMLEKELAEFERVPTPEDGEEYIRYISIEGEMGSLYGLYALGGIEKFDPVKQLNRRIDQMIMGAEEQLRYLTNDLKTETNKLHIQFIKEDIQHAKGLIAKAEEARRQYESGVFIGDVFEFLNGKK